MAKKSKKKKVKINTNPDVRTSHSNQFSLSKDTKLDTWCESCHRHSCAC